MDYVTLTVIMHNQERYYYFHMTYEKISAFIDSLTVQLVPNPFFKKVYSKRPCIFLSQLFSKYFEEFLQPSFKPDNFQKLLPLD